jgi:hypothetical protein
MHAVDAGGDDLVVVLLEATAVLPVGRIPVQVPRLDRAMAPVRVPAMVLLPQASSNRPPAPQAGHPVLPVPNNCRAHSSRPAVRHPSK